MIKSLNIKNYELSSFAPQQIGSVNKPFKKAQLFQLTSSSPEFIISDMLENNKEYDLNISYYVRDDSMNNIMMYRKTFKLETLSLRGKVDDESIIKVTHEPYTELFYNSVENIVLKRIWVKAKSW